MDAFLFDSRRIGMKRFFRVLVSLFLILITVPTAVQANDDVITVSFRVNYNYRYDDDGDVWEPVENGATIYWDYKKVSSIEIEPVFYINGIQQSVDYKDYGAGDVFFWGKWVDSTGVSHDKDPDFTFGDKIQQLTVSSIENDLREEADNEFYSLHFEAYEVQSDLWGPSYNSDKYNKNPIYSGYTDEFHIHVEQIITPDNLEYISAHYYQEYLDEYPPISELYETEQELIDKYLYPTFKETTYLESDAYNGDRLPIHWKLKDDTIYSNQPG